MLAVCYAGSYCCIERLCRILESLGRHEAWMDVKALCLRTTAYIEQSIPFPKDGKQGWWSGGFGYGLWIGILVSSGFTVVPVPSFTWKAKFELSGSKTSKDDSRKLASQLFPSLSSLLTRKKDHGRAEALLIAAYGKDQNKSHEPTETITDEI
ncbi:hypothetical protein L195_g012546 [Trifolium pratense]|uniref:Uncharacterized protein n=1 Tax=Trifolium pratense TaxID=57577 RepID=A0A2K3PKM9_TRIPR|nr:hypothetical protein L195_g012546 [Trifolium pratense]